MAIVDGVEDGHSCIPRLNGTAVVWSLGVASTVRCSAYKSSELMGETGRRHVNIHKQTLGALTDKRGKLRATSYCARY